ncbi:ATP-dependent DNA ligase LigD phosphoesterase module /ATP-dependent DNA ligase LigD polymerase module [Nitrosospira sp. Nsp5]|uniref:DNA ligase (ATP) n=1 Tax=Nitrosospira multiformis TaxID=1231 RepID=A0ABY0THW4_9PROT|nr:MULTISPECIES: DNA ligase D [Nitrosospira]PTR06050.1 ATP-dependent DNA ligase LigD phosphoesterase module /ATP-dependent DNA ligase LigD polymerase module [Nitrosospira sp. Nsp5]SDQ86296.1 ATP-dependent DNA ligase LigD phosphoesterase module /ATP-dependent DNA ligase LigD polymerase module [Nitrosospira multiformis]
MSMALRNSLKAYRDKRNFSVTPEPDETGKDAEANEAALSFVVQKHWATRLHYDFRLELDGTMKSWAVPKGPSYDSSDKRMAIHVEDHPVSYNRFEGRIPAGQYGAGKVIIWDKGIWVPLQDPRKGYSDGKLKFELRGHKLKGHWTLVRMKGKEEGKQEPWLLIKEKDEYVRSSKEYSVVDELPDSVAGLESHRLKKATKPAAASATEKQKYAAGLPENAVKATLPPTLQPQLATLVDSLPAQSADWVYEIKFDGYRILCRIEGKKIQLLTRNGNDWSHKLPDLVKALGKLGLRSGWLDGEIVVLDENGIPDFQALQNAFDSSRTQGIVYYLFDIPFYDGYDLRGVSVTERRTFLKTFFEKSTPDPVRFSETFDAPAGDIVASACHMGLEGVIGKRKTSTYVSRRSSDWIKLKCGQRQEFVIGGYTSPQGSRVGLGSLLLGFYDDDKKLQYAGNVGTGFSDKTLHELKAKLKEIGSTYSPFNEAADIDRKAHWVMPTLVAEVSFGEWTRDGRIRHSVFHGLRTDKKAAAITREKPVHPITEKPAIMTSIPPSLRVTHPERVIDPSTGFTKMELIRYYSLVAPLMLEHLEGRPVSLVRAPDGITGQLFFQKHWEKENMPGVNQLDPALDPGHEPLLEISTAEGLLSAAQMNVIEFHAWNATKNAIGKPDRITFDLDPGEGVTWKLIQESAQLVRVFLNELGLRSFLKTSGGKGLHIAVPIKRLRDWDTVKDFSQAIVQHLARTIPQRFVSKSGPRNRVGKIFIDYLRNGFGATTVSAWSVRAREGLGVSVPVAWEELESLTSPSHWSASNIHERLDKGNEPWADYDATRQSILPAMKILGFKPGGGASSQAE